ncbi:RICIN domain-containing protein [Streptomyces sp. NPDC058877]|uniref:RICIN domain-containing protein n=1 Tax=Streptomyces sp. NPDC058877 TaxID=3346665 RepID=UPI0036A7DF7F
MKRANMRYPLLKLPSSDLFKYVRIKVKLLRKSSALIVALVATAATLSGIGSASAAGPTYEIRVNGKCWTPYGGGSGNGLNIVSWDCNGSTSQRLWWFDDSGRLRHGGKCILPYGGSSNSGANIVMWDCNGHPSQQWGFSSRGDLVTFVNKCVIPYGGSINNGANLIQWECAVEITPSALTEV